MPHIRSRSAPDEGARTDARILLSCLLLGAASGLRSMAAPSQLSRALGDRATRPASPAAAALSRPLVRTLLGIAATGEMVVDKLPAVPDRIEPGPLMGRAVFGGFSAQVLAREAGAAASVGALAGALGAVAGAHGGYRLRRWLVSERGLPDAAVALAEDAAAVLLARQASRADAVQST